MKSWLLEMQRSNVTKEFYYNISFLANDKTRVFGRRYDLASVLEMNQDVVLWCLSGVRPNGPDNAVVETKAVPINKLLN